MLLGMQDVELLKLLRVNCSIIEPSLKSRQINELSVEYKCYANKNLEDNVTVDRKCKHKLDYFIAGPDVDMKQVLR